jgi:Zn-dependent protease
MAFIALPTVSPFTIYLAMIVPIIVLIHEFGHALTAQYFNIQVHSITLFGLGGMARMYKEGETTWQRLAITAAGPGVNLVLAAAGFALHLGLVLAGVVTPDNMFLIGFWAANFILGAFNLIPAFPMDGGRLLRTGLSRFVGYVKATKIATEVSLVLAIGAILLGLFSLDLILVAVAAFVIYTANTERKRVGLKTFF